MLHRQSTGANLVSKNLLIRNPMFDSNAGFEHGGAVYNEEIDLDPIVLMKSSR
jgi:hypothetical protein